MSKNILVINSGSSSIKFQLIEEPAEKLVLKGMVEKLGIDDAYITIKYAGKVVEQKLTAADNHQTALDILFDFLKQQGLIETIKAVGQRVAHGGEIFKGPALITDKVLAQIKSLAPLAPLHNPASILGIEAISKIDPNLPQVAVFDTAFHATMPPEAYRYAVPSDWYHQHGVRRYGFHGTSYKFITEKTAKILGKKPSQVNLIVAHLGNGASISAIEKGRSIANTMGFTPLAGLPMGTRSGNIDPGIIPFIMKQEELTAEQVVAKLNRESGHRAVSDVSDDLRYILEAIDKGDAKAKLSIDIFTRKVAKYIGGFMTLLPRLDALVFTAGIGENGYEIREAIVKRLEIFGFKIDKKVNDQIIGWNGKEGLVSAKTSKYPIYALGTDEGLEIARETLAVVGSK